MLFAHDTEVSLASMTALVNTLGRETDALCDVAALDAFVTRWRWSGSRTHDAAELDAVKVLRTRLRSLWELPEDDVVQLINTLLREARALPQLVDHDGWGYHVHATSDSSPLAQRLAVEFGMAMVDVIRQRELGRLRVCAADDCDDVMIDLSKNRSRRFCDPTCANRMNVAAFRARRRTGTGRANQRDERHV